MVLSSEWLEFALQMLIVPEATSKFPTRIYLGRFTFAQCSLSFDSGLALF